MNNNRLLITRYLLNRKALKITVMNTNKIYTEVIINARIQDVWSVLIDTEKYANWNPLIVHSEGTIKIGKKIKNTLKSGKKTMVFKPTIKQFEPNSCFAWLGHLWFPGIFDGYHSFRLEKTSDNSTKLIHEERFTAECCYQLRYALAKRTPSNVGSGLLLYPVF